MMTNSMYKTSHVYEGELASLEDSQMMLAGAPAIITMAVDPAPEFGPDGSSSPDTVEIEMQLDDIILYGHSLLGKYKLLGPAERRVGRTLHSMHNKFLLFSKLNKNKLRYFHPENMFSYNVNNSFSV